MLGYKLKLIFILVIIAGLLSIPIVTMAMFDWATLKTEHFTVFYQPDDEMVARQVLETLEYYRPKVEKLCGNTAQHLAVVIDKNGVAVNGFSKPHDRQIHLFDYNPNSESLLSAENWWSLVGVHEYTHHLSLSKTDGFATVLNKLFGGMFLPNAFSPLWLTEGITVYEESQLTPYQGRLNDGLFDAYMGVLVSEGKLPSIQAASSEQDRFQLSGGYTFGSEFFEYLSKTYGEERFAQFFQINGGNCLSLFDFPALGIDRSARKVYGKTFPQLWEEWQVSLHQKYQDYQPEGEKLTKTGWMNTYPVIVANQLFYYRNYPVKTGVRQEYQFYELIRHDLLSNQEKVLVSTTTPVVLPLKLKNNQLYYATYEKKAGYHNQSNLSYGYYIVLHRFDLNTRKDKVILNEEIRGFEVTNEGKILYTKAREGQFGSELYLYDPECKKQEKLLVSEYLIDELIGDQERLIVTARQDWENSNLYQLDLQTQTMTPLFKSAEKESNLSICEGQLYFTANYQQKVGIYRYNFDTQKVERLTKNGYAGMAAVDQEHQELYFVGLNSKGFDLYHKPLEPEEHQVIAPLVKSKPTFNLATEEITKGSYWDNLKILTPRLNGFGFAIDSEGQSLGMLSFRGYDAVGDFPQYTAMFGYDSEQEHLSYNFELNSYFLAPIVIGFRTQDLTKKEIKAYAPDLGYQKATQLFMAYDLINKLSPGFSNLIVGGALMKIDDFQNLYWESFFNAKINYPNTKLKLGLDVVDGLYKEYRTCDTSWELKQYLLQSDLCFKGCISTGQDRYLPTIRGYQKSLHTTEGMTMSLEYTKPLIEIGAGLWNPNLYLQSLVGKTFLDQALTKDNERQLSWGAELHLEMVVSYRQPLDLGLCVTWNEEEEATFGLIWKSSF